MKAILYDWGGLNIWLFHIINDVHGPWLDRFMHLGTFLGGHDVFPVYVAIMGVVALFLARRSQREDAGPWLLALAVFAVAYNLDGWLLGWLKPMMNFPRPILALPPETVHLVEATQLHHSLPSGHASFAMLCAASLWPVLYRPWRYLAVGFVVWVGMSRISLGAHFPADVLAGFLSSLLIVLATRSLLENWVSIRIAPVGWPRT
jgi:membrane-associated phospholipid phosphatase